jgi:hypothetical protein
MGVFKNLVMNPNGKVLMQSLVNSHARDHPLDDSVPGKGPVLVINLFGLLAIASFYLSIELKSLLSHRPSWRGKIAHGGGDKRTYVQTFRT